MKTRRSQIMDILKKADRPVSASALAERFGVSRQSIVGDVALLRASGEQITATARGDICCRMPGRRHSGSSGPWPAGIPRSSWWMNSTRSWTWAGQ